MFFNPRNVCGNVDDSVIVSDYLLTSVHIDQYVQSKYCQASMPSK